MTLNYNKYAQEANHFVKELAAQMERSEAEADMILRATLHALRDRISPQESLHFISQLPMFLKALYVDNWKMRKEVIRTNSFDDFVVLVMSLLPMTPQSELNDEQIIQEAIPVVFQYLDQYVSEGEWKDVLANLPQEVCEGIMQNI